MTALTGTGTLFRLFLRRDRITVTAWVSLLVLLVIGVANQYAGLFPTAEARAQFAAEATGNTALIAFTGQIHGIGLGNLMMFKIGDVAFTLVAMMAVLNVVRHTRAEEEAGRAELVGAAVVGRLAALTASVLETWGLSLLIGLLTAVGLIGFGLDAPGSLAFGLALSAPGVVFTAVAALAAQLTERARTANAIAFTALGTGYLIRFVADGGSVLWLHWLSPNGWSHLVQPFAAHRWWVLAVPLLVTGSVTAVAYRLAARRDLGAGVLPARGGPATAAPRLRSPFALAWRLHRGQLLGWTAGLAGLGAASGGVAPGIPALVGQGGTVMTEFFRRYSPDPTASLGDAFLWMVFISLGGMAVLYPMLATLRLRAEETSGRAELLLATPTSRLRWAASHLAFALLGSAVILAVTGLVTGLTYGIGAGDVAGQLPRILLAALVQLPPVWVTGSIAMLAVALLPRLATALTWVVFMLVNLFGEALGPVLGIDYWIANQVVPFHHIPKVLTGGAFTTTPPLIMVALTAAITAAGLAAFQRRDLT